MFLQTCPNLPNQCPLSYPYLSLQAPFHSTVPQGFLIRIRLTCWPWKFTCSPEHTSVPCPLTSFLAHLLYHLTLLSTHQHTKATQSIYPKASPLGRQLNTRTRVNWDKHQCIPQNGYPRRSKKEKSPPTTQVRCQENMEVGTTLQDRPRPGNTCLAPVTEYAWPFTRFLRVVASISMILEIYRKHALWSEDEVLSLLGVFMGLTQSSLYTQSTQKLMGETVRRLSHTLHCCTQCCSSWRTGSITSPMLSLGCYWLGLARV